MGLVGLAPEGEGKLPLQLVEQLVGQDGVLLVGVGIVEHGAALSLKGPADLHGELVRLPGQAEVQLLLQNGRELHPQQPPLGQQAAALLDEVAEVPVQGPVADDQRLPEEQPLFRPADGKGVAADGQVGQGLVSGLAHQAVAQPRPVDIQDQPLALADLPDRVQLLQGVERAVLRGLGEIDHGGLDHVLVGGVGPVGSPQGQDGRRRELPVFRRDGQDLVPGGLDGPRLVDVDVPGVGGDDALVGPQGRGDHRGVDLGPAHQKVDGQILPAPAQGPDLGAGFVAKRIFSISNGLIEIRIRQPPQHAGVCPLGVVTFQSDHKSIPSEFES